jgi:hypothetical protein
VRPRAGARIGTFYRQVKRLAAADGVTALISPDTQDGASSLCVEFCATQAGNITPVDSCGNAVLLSWDFRG